MFTFRRLEVLFKCKSQKKIIGNYRAAIDPFEYCVDNLTWIAEDLNMTYEEVNIYIYCYLFFGIIIFHLGQIAIGRLIRKKRKAKLIAAA